jgi:hypothetical protein
MCHVPSKPVFRKLMHSMLLLFISACAQVFEDTVSLELGGTKLNVPKKYVLSGDIGLLEPNGATLNFQPEFSVGIPIDEFGMRQSAAPASHQPLVLARLSLAESDSGISQDAIDAWTARGLYEERIVDEETEIGLVRIYPKAGYPFLWNYFYTRPDQDSVEQDISRHWLASCRVNPRAASPRFDAADCLTTMRWKNIRLEIRYPGY